MKKVKNVLDNYWKSVFVLLYCKAVPPGRGTQITNKCSKKHKSKSKFKKKFQNPQKHFNAGPTKFKSTGVYCEGISLTP